MPVTDLEGCAPGAVHQEVDAGVEDHEEPGYRVDFEEEQARDVLHLSLDAPDDEGGGEDLVCTGSDPAIVVNKLICMVLSVTSACTIASPREKWGSGNTYMHECRNRQHAILPDSIQ